MLCNALINARTGDRHQLNILSVATEMRWTWLAIIYPQVIAVFGVSGLDLSFDEAVKVLALKLRSICVTIRLSLKCLCLNVGLQILRRGLDYILHAVNFG